TPIVDSVSSIPRIDLAEHGCYYSGNCHIVPYNSFRGDPYFHIDMRLAKNIKLGSESRNVKLIFQAFNLFNHANYGNNFANNTNRRPITKTPIHPISGKKQIVTPDSTFGNPLRFIKPTSSTLPRAFMAEFGARFTF